jgi:hypothetical protein
MSWCGMQGELRIEAEMYERPDTTTHPLEAWGYC